MDLFFGRYRKAFAVAFKSFDDGVDPCETIRNLCSGCHSPNMWTRLINSTVCDSYAEVAA